jgi:hypothetical protein
MRVIGMIVAMMVCGLAVNAQDRAVEAIVKKNQTEVKRSNDAAVKALTNLITTRTRSKDTEGVARCQQAIAQITGEAVAEVAEVADNATGGAKTFPEGTFKWKGNSYYVFPKTKWANYDEAETACKELGGHILRISSKKEFDYFVNYRAKELKMMFRTILEKIDPKIKDERYEQINYVYTEELFKSTNINVPIMDWYPRGQVILESLTSSYDNWDVFVICEWEK